MPATAKQGGGINTARTARQQFFADIQHELLSGRVPAPRVLKVLPLRGAPQRLRILGRNFTPASLTYIGGRLFEPEFVSRQELLLTVPRDFRPGAALVVTNEPPPALYEDPRQAAPPARLLDISVGDLPLRTGQPFALTLRFDAGKAAPARLAAVQVTFPDGEVRNAVYPISAAENQAGRKALSGFAVERGGSLRVHAALYDDRGAADYMERHFAAVPSNPLQLYVYARGSTSPTGKGAAEYRAANNRYYCEARWVIANGYPYPVTIGPRVRCRVTDAGLGQLADFNFNISTHTVPAGASVTLYVYTYHGSGSDVYDLFRKFGDATYEYTLQTSAGDIRDSIVWVAMAQVGVTANFVGDFSAAEMAKVIDTIETGAADIYNKVDCAFSSGTPALVIPRSHGDWSRYRDIRVEENKSGNCVDSAEADRMRDDWSAPAQYNDRIDIFFVESFSGDACASSLGGFSPVGGPTAKGGSNSGVVIDVKDLNILGSSWGEQILGIVIAHEVGHYLGLRHSSGSNNFMAATVGTGNTAITYDQWKGMRGHGFVRRLNP